MYHLRKLLILSNLRFYGLCFVKEKTQSHKNDGLAPCVTINAVSLIMPVSNIQVVSSYMTSPTWNADFFLTPHIFYSTLPESLLEQIRCHIIICFPMSDLSRDTNNI